MKPWYLSKTVWVNLLVLAVSAAADNVAQLDGLLPVPVFKLVAFTLPVANVALRFVTTQGLMAPRSKPNADSQ